MLDGERATGRSAKRAAGMLAAWCDEIARSGSSLCEQGGLDVVEQAIGRAAATIAAREHAARRRFAGGAARARAHRAGRSREPELEVADGEGVLALGS